MPKSRLLDAAERLSIVGNTLNNPEDVAIAKQYVEDLEDLATWEVPAPFVTRSSAPEKERVAMLGITLKQAFAVDCAPRFSSILSSLDLGWDRNS